MWLDWVVVVDLQGSEPVLVKCKPYMMTDSPHSLHDTIANASRCWLGSDATATAATVFCVLHKHSRNVCVGGHAFDVVVVDMRGYNYV